MPYDVLAFHSQFQLPYFSCNWRLVFKKYTLWARSVPVKSNTARLGNTIANPSVEEGSRYIF